MASATDTPAYAPPLDMGLRIRLSIMMFLQFAIWGAWATVIGNYLKYLKFDESVVGWVGSLMPLGAILAPLIVSQLADRCSCVRSNITQLVDRLEADRLVERSNDPHDRRSVRAGLTSAGRERHAEAVQVIQDMESRVLAGLNADDRDSLCRLLGRLGSP